MLTEAILVPIIIALTGAIRSAGLSARFAPFASIVLGILASATLVNSGFSADSVVQGIVLGLTASGLYSGTKAVVK